MSDIVERLNDPTGKNSMWAASDAEAAAEIARLREQCRVLGEALKPLAALASEEADGQFWIGHAAAVAAARALDQKEQP